MSGSVVTIRVNGNPYQLGCDVGQEAEIEALGNLVDETVSGLAATIGQIGEARLLVMAAILLAEKTKNAGNGAPAEADNQSAISGEVISDNQIAALENIAKSISALAASVKSA